METELNLKEIIKKAALDESDSREQLVRLITPKIQTYIFRSTLDADITDDLVQEVCCKMLGSLSTLDNVNSFWAWLYRTTSNCIKSYYRSKLRRPRLLTLQDGVLESVVRDENSAEAKYMSKELGHAVMEAVSALNPRQRQIVTLRCFENLSFQTISVIEETSEVYARVLFHRALEKLRVKLKKQGFRKASLVLALTMFGRLTSVSKAAAIATTVKASTITGTGAVKGSIAAKLIETAATVSVHKIKAAAIIAIAAGAVTTTATVGTFRSNIKSIHYTVQGVSVVEQQTNTTKVDTQASSLFPGSSSMAIAEDKAHLKYQTKGLYENKLYMPQGSEGPILRFTHRQSTDQTEELCSWLQDGSGNYYYHPEEDKTYVTNAPLRMLILPTDPPEFVEFIFSQVGQDSRFAHERKFLTGLMKYSVDNRIPDYPDYKCRYTYNSLERSDLSEAWPQTDNIEDMRDQMHKRGWTYFDVTGLIEGRQVTGTGRIPFIYDMYQDNSPWLSLKVGENRYIDFPNGTAVADTEQDVLLYKNETFFEGFCRPWEGLPCIDSIRRDAAKYRLRFLTDDQGNEATVTVFLKTARGPIKMIYDIDRDADIIRSIIFEKGSEVIGELYFEYSQNIDSFEGFEEPQNKISSKKGSLPDNLWLSMLVL